MVVTPRYYPSFHFHIRSMVIPKRHIYLPSHRRPFFTVIVGLIEILLWLHLFCLLSNSFWASTTLHVSLFTKSLWSDFSSLLSYLLWLLVLLLFIYYFVFSFYRSRKNFLLFSFLGPLAIYAFYSLLYTTNLASFWDIIVSYAS